MNDCGPSGLSNEGSKWAYNVRCFLRSTCRPFERKEQFSKMLNPPDKEISSCSSIKPIIPPSFYSSRSVSVRSLHLCSLDRPSKTSIFNNRNTKMKEKISHNIPNRGWAHIHAHTVDIIEHALVFVVGDLVTLPTSDRAHREVIHHIRVCGSSGTRPMIAKRHSITLWCSGHTHKKINSPVYICVRVSTIEAIIPFHRVLEDPELQMITNGQVHELSHTSCNFRNTFRSRSWSQVADFLQTS